MCATVYNFTNAGCAGRIGPTQSQLNSAYNNTTLSGLVTSINGIQKFVLPSTGIYDITVAGAASGTVGSSGQGNIGYGALLRYKFRLNSGTILYILVGQRPSPNSRSWQDGGMAGGGGTFVAIKDPSGSYSPALNDYVSPLIIAGGAGGPRDNQGSSTGGHGSYSKGSDIRANSDSTTGGGGWTYDSWRNNSNSNDVYNAKSFLNGGQGGTGWASVQGGFGGGGAPYDGGGGGGGYQGGNAYNNSAGSGGLSYVSNSGTLVSRSSGANSSNGYVTIILTKLFSVNVTYDEGFTGVTISPENYNDSDEITITPHLKPGYDWSKWTGDINSNTRTLVIDGLAKNISIHANSEPGETEYKVNHWLMEIGGTEYKIEKTETYPSITGTTVTGNVRTYTGFQSPSQQTAVVKNDGTTVINYYYTRNKYNITVQYGSSDKYEYWYQEKGSIVFDKRTAPSLKVFKYWFADKSTVITKCFEENAQFIMPCYDIIFSVFFEDYDRLNSNIYKNIFPEEVLDLERIEDLKANTISSYQEIYQPNHEFEVYDVLVLHEWSEKYYRDIYRDITRPCPNLTPINVSINYLNGGYLQSGQSTVRVTVTGGTDPWDRTVNYRLDCSGVYSFSRISTGVYDIVFKEAGVFPLFVEARSVVSAIPAVNGVTTIVIKNRDGTMTGSGSFVGTSFDSKWLSSSIIPGCFIDSYSFTLKIQPGHGSSSDTMYILGKKSNGSTVIVRDFFNSSNNMKPYPSYSPSRGNLASVSRYLSGTLSASDDIRQIAFYANSPGHASCLPGAAINYSMNLKFEDDIYDDDVSHGIASPSGTKSTSWTVYGSNSNLSATEKIGEELVRTDLVSSEEHHIYEKAIAKEYVDIDISNKSEVIAIDKSGTWHEIHHTFKIAGVVSNIKSPDIFTLMDSGQLPYPHQNFEDTTILYISDKNPGKLCHYTEIDNMIYIPGVVYTTDSIIIDIMKGSFGVPLPPYDESIDISDNFEHYTQEELNEVVATLWSA